MNLGEEEDTSIQSIAETISLGDLGSVWEVIFLLKELSSTRDQHSKNCQAQDKWYKKSPLRKVWGIIHLWSSQWLRSEVRTPLASGFIGWDSLFPFHWHHIIFMKAILIPSLRKESLGRKFLTVQYRGRDYFRNKFGVFKNFFNQRRS